MTKKEQIRESLKDLAKHVGPLNSILGTVVSVDEDEKTCVIADDDIEINDVRLSPVLTNKESVIIFPKVDSWVLAIRIEEDADWMIVAAEEIDKYRVVVDDMIFEMSNDKFLVKKGADTLKQVIQLIIEAVQPIVVLQGNNPVYANLTQALTKLNNIMQ